MEKAPGTTTEVYEENFKHKDCKHKKSPLIRTELKD